MRAVIRLRSEGPVASRPLSTLPQPPRRITPKHCREARSGRHEGLPYRKTSHAKQLLQPLLSAPQGSELNRRTRIPPLCLGKSLCRVRRRKK